MGIPEIKEKIYDTIETLPPEKLAVILDFLDDLQRSSEEETAMLMNEPGFMKDYLEAKEDIHSCRTVNFKIIRRDV